MFTTKGFLAFVKVPKDSRNPNNPLQTTTSKIVLIQRTVHNEIYTYIKVYNTVLNKYSLTKIKRIQNSYIYSYSYINL